MPIEVLMPALSPTMTEGNLAKWLKKEGDKVAPGDVIAEIETDKATMEVESIDEGTIGKILIKEGQQGVSVNSVIALMLEDGEDKSVLKDYKPKSAPANDSKGKEDAPTADAEPTKSEAAPVAAPASAPAQPAAFTAPPSAPIITQDKIKSASTNSSKLNASPIAKRIAKEAGIDLSIVTGTGPRGRIIKADIEGVIKAGGASKRVARNPIEISQLPNDNMRKTIANRLLQSKQHVPHFYLTIECNIDKLLEARADLNNAAPIFDDKPAYKISVNDLVIKASALALKKVPEANASWTDDAILLYNNVDVSVAVAIDGGLITPIVRNADQKDLPGISNEMKKLAAKARDGKLTPEEFQGGGFSISNLGMYGIKHFSAIINPPQSCILAVGAGQQKPIVDKNGEVRVANIMEVTLSSDHRVVDGAVGAEFLAAFKGYLEKPVTMFV